jgi:hypothetical protein
LVEGENEIVVQLRNASGEVLGVSNVLTVMVEIDEDALLQSFLISPTTDLLVGDEAILEAQVADRVTSLALVVDGASYPLDRTAANTYGGVISFEDPGDYDLLLRLYVDGEMIEEDVEDISVTGTGSLLDVNKEYGIGMIQYVVDPVNPDAVLLSRASHGDVSPYYTVYYGTNPEALNTQLIVSSTGATLSGLSLDDVTYVQVWPSDES